MIIRAESLATPTPSVQARWQTKPEHLVDAIAAGGKNRRILERLEIPAEKNENQNRWGRPSRSILSTNPD